MAVTGTIGNDYVELNNAATESTLQALLNAIQGNSAQVKNLANKSGVNTGGTGNGPGNDNLKANNQTVAENTGVFQKLKTFGQGTADSFYKLDNVIKPLVSELLGGKASVTLLTDAFGTLNPLLGVAADLFGRLVRYQEENFQAYRTMTDAGVNFSGSLTDLRMAAANSYLTLSEFSNLIAKNSDAFSRMGGTADEGALAFSKASNNLLKGSMGSSLMALGFTTEEVNQGLANYIAMSGGRTAQEMKNTKDLTKGAGEYLTELDALAEITGKSRQAQEDELKQLQANQAFQAYMQTLDEAGRAKASAALLEANAKGGKGAAEALQAELMGVAPVTEAGKMFTALGANSSVSLKNMVANVTDSTKTVADQQREGAALGVAVSEDVNRVGKQTIFAMNATGAAGAETLMTMQGTANKLNSQGVKTVADAENQLTLVTEKQLLREKSQADTMAKSEKSMKELGQAVTSIVNTLVEIFMPAITFMTGVVTALAYVLETFKTQILIVGGALLGAYAIGKTYNAVQSMFQKKGSPGAATKGSSKGLFGGGLGPLGSKDNPMHVIIVGNSSGGIAESLAESVADAAGGAKSDARKNREGKVAAGKAGKFLKRAGVIGTVIGAGMIGKELYDTESQLKSGKITKEEASTKQGGLVGELAGGAAGGWGGAAAGAALGTMLLPGIGTLVGGAIGGIVGGFGGGELGKIVGKELGKSSVSADAKSKEAKLADAGTSNDQEIIASLRTMAAEAEKSRKLQERSVRHLDDINNNVDNSGPPSFYG